MSPIVVLVASLIPFVFGLSLLTRNYLKSRSAGYVPSPIVGPSVAGIFTIAGLIGAFIVLLCSTIPLSNHVVILDNDDKVIDVPQRARWARPSSVVQLTRETQAMASVQPITDNPKVRRLGLTVNTEVVDARRFVESMNIKASSLCNDSNGHDLTCVQRDETLFHLYEFMNAHSRELGKFYNPYDPQQTRDLEALMHTHLDEPLATKGMRLVKLAKWTTE